MRDDISDADLELGQDLPWIEPDWSHMEPVGGGGMGYPDAPPLSLQEDLRIGVVFGSEELQFHNVVDLTLDHAGNIYVGSQEGGIRVFSPDGEFLRILGRQGDGPGEFSSNPGLTFQQDTIVAYSPGRITWLSNSGKVLGTMNTRADSDSPMGFLLAAAGAGGLWVTTIRDAPENKQLKQDMNRITWVSIPPPDHREHSWVALRESEVLIAEVPQPPMYCESGLGCAPIAWGFGGGYAADARGYLYRHTGIPYQIDVYDSEGRPVRRISREHIPTETAPMVDRYRANAQGLELRKASLPVTSDFIPALGNMEVSRGGTVLVARPDLDEDLLSTSVAWATYWDLFSPSGNFLGTVELPDGMGPIAISDHAIVGVVRDELGVERIVRLSWGELVESQ